MQSISSQTDSPTNQLRNSTSQRLFPERATSSTSVSERKVAESSGYRLPMTSYGGTVVAGWEPVEAAFHENFAGEEIGASVAVYHRGQPVVNLWGGSFDGGEKPYDDTTLQLVFSTTKGVTAIAIAICVQRGLLDYNAPVSRYWPEFAAHGKGAATVAQLLSHQCGLFSVQGEISLAEALDWNTITARLADTRPEWPIGTKQAAP